MSRTYRRKTGDQPAFYYFGYPDFSDESYAEAAERHSKALSKFHRETGRNTAGRGKDVKTFIHLRGARSSVKNDISKSIKKGHFDDFHCSQEQKINMYALWMKW